MVKYSVLAVLLVALTCSVAFGQAAAPKAEPAAKAAPKGKIAPPAISTLTGKLEVKDKVVSLAVASAKGADGKDLPALKGKTLKLTGPKAAEAEKLAGKEVEVKGMLKNNDTEVTAMSVTEAKPAPPASK